MVVDLAECRARCEWALMHATNLQHRVLAFEARPDVFQPEFHLDRNTGLFTITVEPAPVPSELSFMTGDVVHNLRSCLDHLVWQLAISNGNVPPTFPLAPRDPWQSIQFPIFADETRYRSSEDRYLWGLSDAAKTFIESIQPFRNPHFAALSALHELSNVDKHRVPHLGASIINRIDVWPRSDPPGSRLISTNKIDLPAVIRGRTQIVAMQFDPPPNRAESYLGIGFLVAFDETSGLGRDVPLVATLGQIGAIVQQLIEQAATAGI